MHSLFKPALPVLALCLAGAFHTPSPAASAPNQADKAYSYRAFEVGPGVVNLSAADDLADYQWALKNSGNVRRILKKLDVASLPPINVHRGSDGRIDGVQLPRLEPCNFQNITTDAVAGTDINILPAWELYEQAPEKRFTVVAVIDTGIDTGHPDLSHSIWTNGDEIPGDGIDNDNNGYIDDVNGWNFFSNNNQVYVGAEDHHGTHAAGTIAAAKGNKGIVGITDNDHVKIMPIKALGTEERKGTAEDVVNAIHYAEANGASICNLSFGSSEYNETVAQAIRDSNMLFVVAAGNGNQYGIGYSIDRHPVYPASLPYDNVITVANLLFDGNLDESSNYGVQSVDIAAPGVYILSTVAGNGYGYMSGTSMAAPMVTGVAAMVYSSHPGMSVLDVKNAILSSAEKTNALAGRVLSGGMLDAGAAMAYGSQ